MRHATILVTLFALQTGALLGEQTNNQAANQVPLASTRDQASYAIGLNIGRDLKANLGEVSSEALIQGIRDILANTKPRLSEAQCTAALQVFQRDMQARAAERDRVEGARNRREGQEFLAANKQKPGVVTLPSGLQYQVLKPGTGPSPKSTDRVTTHYHGTLVNGTVFDSSVEKKMPFTVQVGGVIRGWSEALQLMKVGGKWRLFIPAELAYGPRRMGPALGPHSTLIFEVELLGIE